MSGRAKGVADLFVRGDVQAANIDPRDPKTWWLAQKPASGSWLGMTGATIDHALWLSKAPPESILHNAKANVDLTAAVAAYYGLSSAMGGLDPYNFEAEALGAEMIYGPASLPTVDFRVPYIAVHADLSKLRAPGDWLAKGRVRLAWDIYRLNATLGGINGMYCSPFSLAVQLRSYPLLIRDMRKNPAFVHDLLSCLTEEVLPSYLEAQKEYVGLGLALGAAAWQSFPNVTTDMMEEFVLPYDVRLLQKCMGFGMMALPIGGADYCEETPSKFDKSILFKCFDIQIKMAGGAPSLFLLMGRTQDIPIEWIVEYLDQFKRNGVRATFTVEVNARVMRDGPVEQIIAVIRRYIENIAPDHNLTIFTLMQADCPPAHMHAAVAASHAYGCQPLPENFDDVKVVVPQRESFQQYVDKMSNGMGLQF